MSTSSSSVMESLRQTSNGTITETPYTKEARSVDAIVKEIAQKAKFARAKALHRHHRAKKSCA